VINELSRCQNWLGTYVSVKLSSSELSRSELLELSSQAFACIREVHQAMSFQSPDSELTRINCVASEAWVQLSPPMLEVIECALKVAQASDGAFDIAFARGEDKGDWQAIEVDRSNRRLRVHAPLALDLSGIAKGFAVDQATQALSCHCQYAINAGGDLRLSEWHRTSASVILPDRRLLIEVPMQRAALASSSDQFGRATFNHRLARFEPTTAASYSVFADTCMVADALTKVLRLHHRPQPILAAFNAVGRVLQ
jgi:thiamine biosynthesis lipoprotein